MEHPEGLAELAARLRALPPSCGEVRLVAVDGYAGSGKTTFAGRLATALGGAPVVHLDDLATHQDFFDWTGRLSEWVLRPLAQGEPARFEAYDWVARRFQGAREVPAAPVVLLEGVGAGRRAVRPALAELVWMELPAADARARGLRRDGPELAAFWERWTAAEAAHFAADPSRPYAGVRVDGRTGELLPPPLGAPAGGLSGRSIRLDQL
ncbi:hypothetical protein ABH930_006650 [Kitasatospora sp. GAS204A]|uniref:uridine kinase family protein n=1 Tax=unclassified Kitasatospora TaxID=2633591 RepID=UPI0024762F3E|nr:hypothetical protein [Kitasatospora sp. GAS204B]MDH6122374.1 hypothetical protein [Kitasatospora sp. GAS204B]